MHDVLASEQQYPFPEAELNRLKNRHWVLHHVPKNAVGAELGVFRGHFSEYLIEHAHPKKLYLVDPWTKLGETFGWGEAYTCFDKLTTAMARDETIARVARYPNHDIEVVEDYDFAFVAQLQARQEQLDWVYLDSAHSLEDTVSELVWIDRILKADGVIVGDDWMPNPKAQHHGVMRAVNWFVKHYDYQFVVAGRGNQWCIRRNPVYEESVEELMVQFAQTPEGQERWLPVA